MSRYVLKDGFVFKGDLELGVVGDDGLFEPHEGVSRKVVGAVENFLRRERDAVREAAPVMTPEAGDKTPEYIDWFHRNHSAEEFRERYEHRKFAGKERYFPTTVV